jgi:hypothetical protein
VLVHCLEIHEEESRVEVNGKLLTLERGEEKAAP